MCEGSWQKNNVAKISLAPFSQPFSFPVYKRAALEAASRALRNHPISAALLDAQTCVSWWASHAGKVIRIINLTSLCAGFLSCRCIPLLCFFFFSIFLWFEVLLGLPPHPSSKVLPAECVLGTADAWNNVWSLDYTGSTRSPVFSISKNSTKSKTWLMKADFTRANNIKYVLMFCVGVWPRLPWIPLSRSSHST